MIVNELLALPLLPAKKILNGFDIIKHDYDDFKKTVEKTDIHEVFEKSIKKLGRLIEYFDSYWLTEWSPDEISVYRQKHRTNNSLEGYHKWLNKYFKERSTPKLLLSKLGE